MSGLLRFPNINNVTISGRLTRDIELKFSANNVAFARICIAVDHTYRDEYGNIQKQASFVDAVAFGKTAQICQESLKKGSAVLIEGSLKTRTFTDQNNQSRKNTDIMINRIYPLERDENYVPNNAYQGQSANPAYSNTQNNFTKPNTNTNMTNENNDFQSYESNFNDMNTENDVPF